MAMTTGDFVGCRKLTFPAVSMDPALGSGGLPEPEAALAADELPANATEPGDGTTGGTLYAPFLVQKSGPVYCAPNVSGA